MMTFNLIAKCKAFLCFISSWWHGDFVKALKYYRDSVPGRRVFFSYLCYRNGLFYSASKTSSSWCPLDVFGKCVSAVAIGDRASFDKYLNVANRYFFLPKIFWRELALSVAPYNPELGFTIALNRVLALSDVLPIALACKNFNWFKDNLESVNSDHFIRLCDERNLFLATYWKDDCLKVDDLFGKYFSSFGLRPVTFIDRSRSLSVENIKVPPLKSFRDGPLVSIIVTVFDNPKYVETSLGSLAAQDYRNLEIIVVGDAPSLEVATIVRNIAEADPRFKFIELPVNLGTYGAKNIGLFFASGVFVTCHDSDDFAHPEKIYRQVCPLIANSEIACTISDWIRVDDGGRFHARAISPLKRVNPASPMFRRNHFIKQVGFWDFVRTGADSEFLGRIKLIFGQHRVARVGMPLTVGSHHDNSLTTCKGFGFVNGISATRWAYWEAWKTFHINSQDAIFRLRLGYGHFLSREFESPDEISGDVECFEKCITFLGIDRNFFY